VPSLKNGIARTGGIGGQNGHHFLVIQLCVSTRIRFVLFYSAHPPALNSLQFQRLMEALPNCYNFHDHDCTCGVHQYPWHDTIGYMIDKRGDPLIPLHSYFDQETYNLCFKNFTMGKVPGLDKISNSILKNLPTKFHTLLFLFFTHCYKTRQIPSSWKTSLTILLYKKRNPTELSNYRPIAHANTIYKFFTSTLTTILAAYREKYQILHDS
jgi:hypothetical protein